MQQVRRLQLYKPCMSPLLFSSPGSSLSLSLALPLLSLFKVACRRGAVAAAGAADLAGPAFWTGRWKSRRARRSTTRFTSA